MYLTTFFLLIPISNIKDIENLNKMSIFGVLTLLYSVMVSLIEFPFYFMTNYHWTKIVFFKFDNNIIKVICLYFFAFGNHNIVLDVLQDLSNPKKKRCLKVVNYSFNIQFYIYITVMFLGYFSTFQDTNEIFIDREGQSIFLIFGKLLYNISLISNIGLYYYFSKPSFEVLFNDNEKFSEKK
jgi:amino acid permease